MNSLLFMQQISQKIGPTNCQYMTKFLKKTQQLQLSCNCRTKNKSTMHSCCLQQSLALNHQIMQQLLYTLLTRLTRGNVTACCTHKVHGLYDYALQLVV